MKKNGRRAGLAKRISRVQARAERAATHGYRATLDLLPNGPRKAVKQATHQLEAQAEELSRRSQKALGEVEKRSQALIGRVEKALKTVGRRGERLLATVDTRRAQLIATLEKAVAEAVRPLAHGLDLATLSDLERLSRRLTQLERKRSLKRAA